MIRFLASGFPYLLRCAAVLVFLGLPFWAAGQGENWIKRGNHAFKEQDYSKSIEYFKWAIKKKAGAPAYEGLGKCYWATKDYDKSETYYHLAAQKSSGNPINYFYLGRALLANQKNTAAEDAFRRFASAAPSDPLTAFADINNFFPIFLADSANYAVEKLPINSGSSDFAPAWYGQGIAFSSARKRGFGVTTVSTVDGAPLLDLWYTEPDSAGLWSKPVPIPSVNSRLNEGPLCIDPASGKLYFTRNDPDFRKNNGKKKGLNRLRIFEAEMQDGEWVNIQDLPFNTVAHPVGHPTLSADGKLMYFSGEFPIGAGGTDIYVVAREGDSWGTPQNLGPAINTAGDELFPTVMADGTLMFASDGHLGLGGLDMFSARADGRGGWLTPVNLGYPLNTHADDFAYISRDGGKSGYFSSNRGGDASDDNIYAFEVLRPSFDCQPQEQNNYCYQFTDRGTHDLDTDTLRLISEWNMGNGVRMIGDTVEYCFPGPGLYHVELNLIDTISGFTFLNQVTYDLDLRDIEQVFIAGPDTVAAGETALFSGTSSVVPDCEVKDYFWEFSDGRKTTGAEVEHIFARPGRYQIRLGTAGDSLAGTRRCLDCVFREVLVLPPVRLRAIQDSVTARRAEKLNRHLESPAYRDSMARIEYILQTIRQAKDSSGKVYNIPLEDQNTSFDPENSGLPDSPTQATPLLNELKEGLVVELKDTDLSPETDPQFVRIPAKVGPETVTVFSGKIHDIHGNPLDATISLEDLAQGIRIVRSKANEHGEFRLELPNGQLYGYFIEKPEYYPVSNHIDLRNSTDPDPQGTTEILINQDITMMTVKQIFEQGISVRINNVFFDYDSATLRPESRPELDRLARILIENADLDVEILGHTDGDGSADYNLLLSQRRANSVLRYLILSGYEVSKIKARGYGKARPVASNATPEGKQLNRRVEFRLIPARK